MKLVIVESPTKAKTISKFLGIGFVVESSFGHVRDLPKSKLGVDLENNFEPQYVIPTKSKKTVSKLKAEVKDVDEVILATDEDREGEAIAWHLAQALNLETVFLDLVGMTYCGSKLFSKSTPSLLLGKSRTWPKEDSTTNPLPKNLDIVFAFVGLSTITSFIFYI